MKKKTNFPKKNEKSKKIEGGKKSQSANLFDKLKRKGKNKLKIVKPIYGKTDFFSQTYRFRNKIKLFFIIL